MPIIANDNFRAAVIPPEGSRTLSVADANRFLFYTLTDGGAITLVVPEIIDGDNLEIDILNSFQSLANITLMPENANVVFDISPDLTPVVAPGGIVELKRIGDTNVWSVYGFLVLA